MSPYALHDGDPLDLFRIKEFCDRIRSDYAKGDFFESLIQKHLLTNNHYLQMKYTADPTLSEKQEQEKVAKLSNLDKTLSKEEK